MRQHDLARQCEAHARAVTLGGEERNENLAGNLRIDGVTSEDEGWFGCFAVSVTGSSSALAKLSLKSNPHQPPPIIQLGNI